MSKWTKLEAFRYTLCYLHMGTLSNKI